MKFLGEGIGMRADNFFIVGNDCFMRMEDLGLIIYTKLVTEVKPIKNIQTDLACRIIH